MAKGKNNKRLDYQLVDLGVRRGTAIIKRFERMIENGSDARVVEVTDRILKASVNVYGQKIGLDQETVQSLAQLAQSLAK